MVKRTVEDIYTDYYLRQAGSGFSNVYSGPIYQKGSGIGSFLGGLFRVLFPLLKSGTAVVGSELLKTGANILSDITHNEEPHSVIKKRGKETINNLGQIVGNKMFGAGYKLSTTGKRRHSQANNSTAKKRKTVKKKQAKKVKTKPKKTKNKPKKVAKRQKKTKLDKSEVLDIFS